MQNEHKHKLPMKSRAKFERYRREFSLVSASTLRKVQLKNRLNKDLHRCHVQCGTDTGHHHHSSCQYVRDVDYEQAVHAACQYLEQLDFEQLIPGNISSDEIFSDLHAINAQSELTLSFLTEPIELSMRTGMIHNGRHRAAAHIDRGVKSLIPVVIVE